MQSIWCKTQSQADGATLETITGEPIGTTAVHSYKLNAEHSYKPSDPPSGHSASSSLMFW